MEKKYKRILFKLSGEALANGSGKMLDDDFVSGVIAALAKCLAAGVEVGIVVGAGNIWRGRQGVSMDRVRGDYMGMLATAINALALADAFAQQGIALRGGLHCAPLAHRTAGTADLGTVRASVSAFSRVWEIDRFLGVADKLAARYRP